MKISRPTMISVLKENARGVTENEILRRKKIDQWRN